MNENDMNILGDFLGRRDLKELSQIELKQKYGIMQADLFVLFGGSILNGADVFAEARKNHIARKYMIVGGHGHTTEFLRQKIRSEYPDLPVSGISEAEMFDAYLQRKYDIHADLLECRSTNCGNNITYFLTLLKKNQMDPSSVILCQDATMQLRMWAGMKKYRPDILTINYASYHVAVKETEGILKYISPVHGMWDMDQYMTLLMGEIPRLTDDENGYGPKGRDFIAHVDIPDEVRNAFLHLEESCGDHIRNANPAYAS